MDIDLLSKMVYDLILEHDRVALPGVGCFVAEIVPASFSDRGYTINPPYRKLCFRSHPDDGSLLVQLYAKANDVSGEAARRIITDFLSEMKEVLHARKVIVFPGLGRLRATKENNLFFVADETLDIYPEGFGLQPLSLKTHKETEQELTEAMNGLAGMLHPEPTSEQTQVQASEQTQVQASEQIPETAPETASEKVSEKVLETAPEPISEPSAESPSESLSESISESSSESSSESIPKSSAESPSESISESLSESIPEPSAEPISEPTPAKKKKSPVKVTLVVLLSLILAAALFFGIFMLLSRCFPDFLDTLLYTREELEIINYKL